MNSVFCFRTFRTFPDPCIRQETTHYVTDLTHLTIVSEYPLSQASLQPMRTSYQIELRQRPALQIMQQLAYRIDGPIERLPWDQLPAVAAHLLLLGP